MEKWFSALNLASLQATPVAAMPTTSTMALFSAPISLDHAGLQIQFEIITELILKRAGPVIFKTFLLELIAFRPIPVICPARGVKTENYWKP